MNSKVFNRVPDSVISLVEYFNDKGIDCFPVGGAVRDIQLGRDAFEWDLAVSCNPEKVMMLHPDSFPSGLKHGTVTVFWMGEKFEITSFRKECGYVDGRRPGKVEFGVTLKDDLARRDFTINAMALDLNRHVVIDPFGGRKDLHKRIIRCVGDPVKRFAEDGLRPFRAVRFSSVLEFSIHKSTMAAIKGAPPSLHKVSIERIREEFMKMLTGSMKPSRGMEILRKTNLLQFILPELIDCLGVTQNRWHKKDVYLHSLKTMDYLSLKNPLLRFTGLIHDICSGGEGPDYTFYGHEKVGIDMVNDIMKRLRFSKNECHYVCQLVKYHMFFYSPDWKDGAVRRFISKVGFDLLPDIVELQRADVLARGTHVKSSLKNLEDFKTRIEAINRKSAAMKVSDLNIDGDDVMKKLKIGPGPIVGTILATFLEKVLDDPELNTKRNLMILLNNYNNNKAGEKKNNV